MNVAFFVLGQTKRVVRAERANFERWDREFQIIDWTRRRREVKHVVDLLFRNEDEVRDIVFNEPEILVPSEMADVRRVTGDQIVNGDDTMTFRQKPVYEMRAEKTRTSGDDRNGLGILGHSGVVLVAAAQVYQQEVRRMAL